MALDFIATSDGTKIPSLTRTDGAPASGTVEVPESVASFDNGSQAPVRVSSSNPLPVYLGTGSSVVGKIQIDQTTPGTTNGVQIAASIPSGSNTIGNVGLVAGSAIVGKFTTDQTTHGTTDLVAADITKVGGASLSIGQQLAGASIPVVLPAAQVTTLTPPTTVTVTQGTGSNLHAVVDSGTITTVSAVTAITNALPSGANTIGNVGLVAGTAIVGKFTTDQTTHGTTDLVAADITKVGGSALAIGQQLAGASLPVVLPAAQITTLTPPTTVTVTQGTGTNLHVVNDAGTSVIGKVGVDQTTPGTTNLVAVAGPSNAVASLTNPVPTTLAALYYPSSGSNNTSAQLGAGATFTGTAETIVNQQAAQITVVCDQPYTVICEQFQDAGATKKVTVDAAYTFTRAAGVPLAENVTLVGNYFRLKVTNTGASATTTLSVDVTFGIMPTNPYALSNLGNQKSSLNEVSGTAVTLGQKTMATSLPVVISSDQSAIPVTGSFSASAPDNVVIASGTIRDPLSTVKGTNSSGGFSATISAAMPASVANGDTLVLIVTQALAPTFTTPSGWTLYPTTFTVSNVKAVIYTKTAAGTEGGTNVTVASTVTEDYGTTTYVFNGTVSIEANAFATALSSSAITCPGLASVSANGRLVINAYISGGTSAGLPSIAATGQTMTAQSGSAASSTVAIRTGYEQIATGGSASQRTTSAGNIANSLGVALIVATPVQTTSWLSTTGYQTLAIALTGNWAGNLDINGSHDQTRADPLLVQETNGAIVQDGITGPGLYFVRSITPYVQISTAQLVGTITYSIVGKAGMGPDSLSLLSQALDPASTVNLNVNVAAGLPRDVNASVVASPSDCKTISWNPASANQTITIDTYGYQSLNLTCVSGNINTPQYSNDGTLFNNFVLGMYSLGGQTWVVNPNGSGNYLANLGGRFLRLTSQGAGQHIIVLRPYLMQNYATNGVQQNNVSQIGGTNTVAGGLAGTLAVGGAAAVGATQTTNPIVIGGIDANSLTRRLLTDSAGRLTSQSQLLPTSNSQNVAPLAVMDVTNHESISKTELLWQILTELKIHSHYLFNLPQMLNSPYGFPVSEEPTALRNAPQDFDHPISN